MADDVMVRPELISLEPADRQRVLQQVTAKGGHCEAVAQPTSRSAMRFTSAFCFLTRMTTHTWWR